MQTIDGKWREHLLMLEHLRSVVGFRGYAQRDPLNEYKNEAFQLFETMLDSLRAEVTKKLSHIKPLSDEEQRQMIAQIQAQRADHQSLLARLAKKVHNPDADHPKGCEELPELLPLALSDRY